MVVNFPILRDTVNCRAMVASVLWWPFCAAMGHREHYEAAMADTVSMTEAAAIIMGEMPMPELTGRTIRYTACRCNAVIREEEV